MRYIVMLLLLYRSKNHKTEATAIAIPENSYRRIRLSNNMGVQPPKFHLSVWVWNGRLRITHMCKFVCSSVRETRCIYNIYGMTIFFWGDVLSFHRKMILAIEKIFAIIEKTLSWVL